MTKLLFCTLLLFVNSQARENPFFPSAGEKDIPYTSNEDQSTPKLKRATISLPPQARVLKKVTIEYKNLDGSLEEKTIELDNSIDWHLPIFISQNYGENSKSNPSSKNIIQTSKEYKEVAKIKYAKFLTQGKSIKIITDDTMIRNFLLVQPHRIVMDFKRDSHLKAYTKKLKNSVFTKIRVGNHRGYYRIVIELDGYYHYKLRRDANNLLISLQ